MIAIHINRVKADWLLRSLYCDFIDLTSVELNSFTEVFLKC